MVESKAEFEAGEKKNRVFKIKCSDGVVVECEERIAEQMNYIKGQIDDCQNPEDEIPQSHATSILLKKMMKFIKHMLDNDPPNIEKPIL